MISIILAATLPFIYGAQYYRAPTPAPEYWEQDLKKIKESGFNTVKYWVQWRWSERKEGEYYWEDLDKLMDLAAKNDLKVVLNLILDVMPVWVARDYPDSLMVGFDGRVMKGDPILCRQLGGYPGPCYANKLMTAKRQRFTKAAYEHFRGHPALWGWDVWNEPETHATYRGGSCYPYLCYCQTCQNEFKHFCEKKYATIEKLNAIWGRCYNDFSEVEVPTMPDCVADFVDWREMQMRKLHEDAAWRLKLLKATDPKSVAHLHIVCSLGGFSPLTGVDDYDCAPESEIYGSSMVNEPYFCCEGISAAQGRRFYNAEWHLNWGSHSMYPPVITREYFQNQQFAQLGWGIFGYLFWQFRTEALGTESPAWGLINLDGSERPALKYASEFVKAFKPYSELFMECRPAEPEVVIFRNWENEFHQFARFKGDTQKDKSAIAYYHNGIAAYAKTLYDMNVQFGMVTADTLKNATKAKILILPQAMYLGAKEAEAIKNFASKPGSKVIAESSLGAYDRDTNRFSAVVPGKGLAEFFGLKELDRTAAFHLPSDTKVELAEGSDDVSKAMKASGVIGDNYFKISSKDGAIGWGARDFITVSQDESTSVLAEFHGVPVIVKKGKLIYCGTCLGAAATEKEEYSLVKLVLKEALGRDVAPSAFTGLHVDYLYDQTGAKRFLIAMNNGEQTVEVTAPDREGWVELFGGDVKRALKPGESVMLVKSKK